mgnify:FL=1
MKTKPTQYAVRTLNGSGIQPDVIVARSVVALDDKRKEKLAMFCNVPMDRIISAPDVDSIYDIPINFEKEGLGSMICDVVDMKCDSGDNAGAKKWKAYTNKVHSAKKELQIAVIGKYFDTGDFVLADSYLSVIEAIKYSSYTNGVKPKLTWINSVEFEKDKSAVKRLSKFDGVIVPGGFGSRGVEGILTAIEFIRKNKIPYFGLCYGMQLLVIEYARNVLGLKDANTREVNPKSSNIIIDIMESQKELVATNKLGGSMRLGAYPAKLKKGSVAAKAYGKDIISERHRHRYEVNNAYVERLTNKGLVFSGVSPSGTLMEIAELSTKDHPFFLGTQFHPEFLARPLDPHPLFSAFIKACIKNK